jgi:hypothetical protein
LDQTCPGVVPNSSTRRVGDISWAVLDVPIEVCIPRREPFWILANESTRRWIIIPRVVVVKAGPRVLDETKMLKKNHVTIAPQSPLE